ncbi:glycosyltransferase family 4 protein [Candidatus Gottesmanbacteria bacterium]|nr:glycosyltransferase family 4 protein [Candidatus Gottesmanbacteria bacterium]
MKILILSQTFPLTPADSTAHFMYDFARGFKECGHEVFVLLPYHPNLKKGQFKGLNICTFRYIWPERLHLLGYGRTLTNDQQLKLFTYFLAPFYFLFGFLALLSIVKKEKIEVMNAHWLLPNGFIASIVSKITGIPLVITLPGSDVYLVGKNAITRKMAAFAVSQSKAIVTNSPELLHDLGKYTNIYKPSLKKYTNLHTPIISYSVPANSGRRRENNAPNLAFAGRNVEKKGLKFLQSIYPDIEIISDLPIDEFRKKLLSVDIFVAPSIRDSAGNLDDASLVVLEAMAAGCAVVTSDLPGYRMIIKNGENGLLVKPNDLKAWRGTIERLKKSNMLRQKLGSNARQTISKYFTPAKIARRYTKFFKDLSAPTFKQ